LGLGLAGGTVYILTDKGSFVIKKIKKEIDYDKQRTT